MKKLKRILRFNNLEGNFFLIGLGIILISLTIIRFNYFYLILAILYLIYLLIVSYKYLIITTILIIIIVINLCIRYFNYQKGSYGSFTESGLIISVREKTSSNQIIFKSKGLKYIFYDETKSLKIGDKILVNGSLTHQEENHIPYLFNYAKYLQENNIKGVIEDVSVQKQKTTISIYKIHQKILNLFNTRFKGQTRAFLKALLIGDKNSLGTDLSSDIQSVGIGHLFVISGLHMNVLSMLVTKLLRLCKIPKKLHNYIIILFFFGYFLITLYLISILRVLLTFTLSCINKKNKLNLSNLDIYIISIILILLVNPYYLFNYSFLLTYVISTSLVVISPLLKFTKIKGFILNNLMMSINSILVTIPIIININPTINFLSIIYNLFYIPFVTYLLLPFSIIVLCFSFLSPFYELIINAFIKSTSFFSNISFGRLSFSTISIIIPVLYYISYLILIIFLLNKSSTKKVMISLSGILFILVIWNNYAFLNSNDEIYFLDLQKGESTVIIKAFNQANIIIDTGEDINNDLEIFLKKKGITRLDYVIISHSDSDHNGRLPYLIKEFKIKNIVINKYDDITYQMCINNKFKGNIIKVQEGSQFLFKNIKFSILSPSKNYQDSNNNSIVMEVEAFNKKILMTGDIEKEVEDDLLNRYQIYVDIYKIPHHGSLTSSIPSFVNAIDYDYAICMSGYRNTFGHPNNNVIKRYNKGVVLLTKDEKTILFKKRWYEKNIKFVKFKSS